MEKSADCCYGYNTAETASDRVCSVGPAHAHTGCFALYLFTCIDFIVLWRLDPASGSVCLHRVRCGCVCGLLRQALHIAASEGRVDVCTLLIKAGAGVNAITTGCAGLRVPYGQTALHRAAMAAAAGKTSAPAVMRLLVDSGECAVCSVLCGGAIGVRCCIWCQSSLRLC